MAESRTWLHKITDQKPVLLILVLFFVIWFCCQLYLASSVFRLDYDEGVYLLTAVSHGEGLSLYRDVFFSQPPLAMELLTCMVRIFGNSVFMARLPMILSGFVVIAASGLIAGEMFNKRVALLTALLCGTNYHLFNTSAVVQMDMQSLALALLAMYALIRFNRTRNLWWAVLSSLFFALTNSVKLLELFFVFPIAYLLVLDVFNHKPLQGDRKSISRTLLGMAIYVIVFIAVIGIIISRYDIPSLKSQVLGMGSKAVQFSPKARKIIETYFEWYLSLFLFALAGLFQIFRENRRKAVFFAVWIFSQLLFHFLMSAWVLEHHLIVLFPVLLMVSAAGLDALLQRYKKGELSFPRKPGNKRAAMLVVGLIFIVLVVIPSIGGIAYRSHQRTHDLKFIGGEVLQKLIEEHTEEGDLVVTDEQMAIFRSGRKADPNLIDTSSKRIETGYINEQDLIELGSKPVLVAFWTRRLEVFKGYSDYVSSHYELVYEQNSRKVFVKK
jgi:4-amino-4-deoxy-L-arabinose transferase-like glycosyltransferase